MKYVEEPKGLITPEDTDIEYAIIYGDSVELQINNKRYGLTEEEILEMAKQIKEVREYEKRIKRSQRR